MRKISKTPVLFHINYFEQGQTLERACELARGLGGDGIEFRRKPASFAGSDLEYLDAVSRAVDKQPLEWVSFGAPGIPLMEEDAAEIETELNRAEAFYRKAAERFPLKIINAFSGVLQHPDSSLPYVEYWHHGSAIATDTQWKNAIAGYRRMGALAEELGFKFAFETHGVYLHDTAEAAVRLATESNSDHVGVLWDHANLMLFKNPPTLAETIDMLGPKLFYVHLKNLLLPPHPGVHVSSLSGGIINIREQLRLLFTAGYDGPLCIEAPRPGDRELFAREDIAYVREVLAGLDGESET